MTRPADREVTPLVIELGADEIALVSGGIDPQGPIIVTGTRMRIEVGGTGSGMVERADYEQFPTLMPVDPEGGAAEAAGWSPRGTPAPAFHRHRLDTISRRSIMWRRRLPLT